MTGPADEFVVIELRVLVDPGHVLGIFVEADFELVGGWKQLRAAVDDD